MAQMILYKCSICGSAYPKRAALAGHMNLHKGETAKITARIPRDLRDQFTALCHKHNATTCQVLTTLIKAALKGEELGVINLGSPNPLVINVNEYFLGKPRSMYRALVDSKFSRPNTIPNCRKLWCLDFSSHQAYCGGATLWVDLSACMRCNLREGSVDLRG